MIPRHGFVTIDLGAQYLQAVELATTGRPEIPIGPLLQPVVEEFFPWRLPGLEGPIRDWSAALRGSFYTRVGDRFYVIYSITFATLQACIYRIAGERGLVILPILAGALVVWATYLLGTILGLRRPWWPALMIGLGSPIAFYSVLPWAHAPATAATTAAIALLMRRLCAPAELRPRLAPMLGAGWLLGTAASFRNEGLLLLAVIAVVLPCAGGQAGRRAWLPLLIGAALGLAPTFTYNTLMFGSPLDPTQAAHTKTYRPAPEEPRAAPAKVPTAPAQTARVSRISGALTTLESTLCKSENLSPLGQHICDVVFGAGALVIIAALWGLTSAALAGVLSVLAGVLYLPLAFLVVPQLVPGLLLCSPFLLFGIAALCAPVGWEKPGGRFLCATTLAFIGGVSLRGSAGWQWGGRYLLLVQPILGVLAGLAFERLESTRRRSAIRLQLAVLAFAGVAMSWVGFRDLRSEQAFRQDVEQATVREFGARAVATDLWWFAWENSPLVLDHELFYFHRTDELERLLDHLATRGVFAVTVITRRSAVEVRALVTTLQQRSVSVRRQLVVPLPGGQDWHALLLGREGRP